MHVHGAHDHAVEHEGHKRGLGQQVAIFSAVLATVGAIVSFLGGHTQNNALLYKNEAVLKRAEASDQWNFYQAKSMKQNLAELASSIATDPEKAAKYRAEAAALRQREEGHREGSARVRGTGGELQQAERDGDASAPFPRRSR